MWFGPTAKLLSDGFLKCAVPCGPSKPAPSPSKLSTSGTGGRLPCDVCSTARAAGGIDGGAGDLPCESCDESNSATGAVQATLSHAAGFRTAPESGCKRSGRETSNFIARCTTTELRGGLEGIGSRPSALPLAKKKIPRMPLHILRFRRNRDPFT